MIFFIPIILQALLIIHVYKTGRDRFWIFILIFVPFAGGLAYLAVAILPDLVHSSSVKAAHQNINKAISPNRELELLQSKAARTPTLENIRALGEEYLRRGNYGSAIDSFKQCLQGPFSDNVPVMTKLAWAYYESNQLEAADTLLNEIIQIQQDDQTAEVFMLHGNIKNKLGDFQNAEESFQAAAHKSSDLKYKFKYGKYLSDRGEVERANVIFHQIFLSYETMPAYSRKFNRKWINLVKDEIKKT